MENRLKAHLATGHTNFRTHNTTQMAIALQKRNLNRPENNYGVDESRLADEMTQSFISEFCEDPAAAYPILTGPTLEGVYRYRVAHPSQNFEPDWIINLQLDHFKMMLKRDVKNKLADSVYGEYTPAATIFYNSDSFVKIYFGCLLVTISSRLMMSLKETVHIYKGVTTQYLADVANSYLGDGAYNILELDMSKFDKSQGSMHLKTECMILKHFGMSDELLDLYYLSTLVTKNVDPISGITLLMGPIRKTGGWDTFDGNTIVTMAAIAHRTHGIGQADLLYFGGDDSTILSKTPLVLGENYIPSFNNLFNFEVKLYTHRFIYFSSKFILFNGVRYVAVPDPVKLLVRLGRGNIANLEHLHEYYLGIVDNSYDLIYSIPAAILEAAIFERYKKLIDVDNLLNSLSYFLQDFAHFKELFYNINMKDPKNRVHYANTDLLSNRKEQVLVYK